MSRRRLDLDDPRSLAARLPRMIEATGERIVAEGSWENLHQLDAWRRVLEQTISATIEGLVYGSENPPSWSNVAEQLGVTKQEAHRRYSRKARQAAHDAKTPQKAEDR